MYPAERAGVMWIGKLMGKGHRSAIAISDLLEKYPAGTDDVYVRTDPERELFGLNEALGVIRELGLPMPNTTNIVAELKAGIMQDPAPVPPSEPDTEEDDDGGRESEPGTDTETEPDTS